MEIYSLCRIQKITHYVGYRKLLIMYDMENYLLRKWKIMHGVGYGKKLLN